MKFIKMEYPDGTMHDTMVTDYKHSLDKGIDFIDYHDINEDKNFYAIVKEVDGVLYKDPTITDYTYDELSKNTKELSLDDLPGEIKNLKNNNSKYELEFEVYSTDTGLYIASTIAEAFHLSKKYRHKIIDNVVCVPVTEEEVKRIEIISSQGIPALKRKIINEYNHDHQAQAEFSVYHIPSNNKYFIQEKLCNEFNVGYGVHYINGIQCKEVLFDDIKKIEEDSKYKTTCLKANFMELSFGKRFVNVYKNDEKEKFYIKNEQCEQYNIGRGHHYINSDLYKEVSKSELESLENQRIELKYTSLKFNRLIQQFAVFVDDDSKRLFIDVETSETLGIGKGTHFVGSKKCKEVTEEEINEIRNSTKYTIQYEPHYIYLRFSKDKMEENVEVKEEDKTTVYKDKNNNNKLYISKEDCRKFKIGNENSFKYVNYNECYEISLIELTKIKNPVVKTIYKQEEVEFTPKKEKKETFLVCNFEGLKFIDEEIALEYNIPYETSIRVDNKRFVQVDAESINIIEESSDLERKEVTIRPTKKKEEVPEETNKISDEELDRILDEEINNMIDEKTSENEQKIK